MKNFLFQNLNPHQAWIGWLTTFAVIAVFILFPLGHLTRLYLPIGGAIYLHELPLLAVVGLQLPLLTDWLRSKTQNLPSVLKPEQVHLIKISCVLLLWLMLGMVTHFIIAGDLIPLLYISRVIVYCVFLVVIKLVFAPKLLLLQTWLFLSGVWYWWLAVLQYFLLPDTRFLSIFGWDDHYYRMIGSLFDPGLTGILLVLTLLCLYSLHGYHNRIPKYGNVLYLAAMLGLVSSVVTTYSRASYLSLAIAILLLFLREYLNRGRRNFMHNHRKVLGYVVTGLVIIAAVYLSIPKPGGEGIRLLRTSTVVARVESATHSLTQLTSWQWILGTGLFSQPATQQPLASKATIPDNIFVTLLTQTGSIGLGLTLYLLVKVMKLLWNRDALALSAVAAVLVQSQFNNTALHPYIIFYLGIFLITRYLRVTLRSTST